MSLRCSYDDKKRRHDDGTRQSVTRAGRRDEPTGAKGDISVPKSDSRSRAQGPSVAEVSSDIPKLPHNLEAERSILGAILLDDRCFKIAAAKAQPDDFFIREHRLVFIAMWELARRGDPIDPVTVSEELAHSDELANLGGIGYISQLADGLPRITNVEHYARIVKEKSAIRFLLHSAAALQERALDPTTEAEDLIPLVQAMTAAIEVPTRTDSTLTIPDMSEDVLDGRLGDICQARMSGLPLSYAWVSLVAVGGTMVPVSPHVRTNLFTCNVGPIGTGKSQAIERALGTLGLGKPQLENTLAGSFEGLSEKLDVGGDARLLSPDELGHLLTKAKIDGASFPFVLNSAYYKDEFDVTAARGKKIHVHCRLGIIGGIVEDKFSSLFGAATTGGLYDRFIFGRCPSPYEFRYRPFEGPPENTEPCPVTIAADVWELRDTWLKEIHGLSPRCAELTIRVATIAAAFSGRSILYAKAIEKSGRAFAEYQARMRAAFRPNPGENTDAQCAWDVRSYLAEHPGWNPKRTVYRAVNAHRHGPAAFERAISAMVAGGEIDVKPGRPVCIRVVE